jgi:NADH:ubiquinone oxidoreductase subunit 6 (subunit J)
MGMSKIEKRLSIFAILFVVIYIGAVVLTIHSRVVKEDRLTRIESAEGAPGEEHLMLVELFLPMLLLLTITVCFLIVKKKRSKAELALEQDDDSLQ